MDQHKEPQSSCAWDSVMAVGIVKSMHSGPGSILFSIHFHIGPNGQEHCGSGSYNEPG